MSDFSSLTGQFLISLPSMQEDYFSHSVTLLIEHNQAGAFGLVINKPLDAKLSELLADQNITCHAEVTLLESGPVEQNRLFFVHSNEKTYEGSVAINQQLALTTSLELIEAVSAGVGPTDLFAGLGYAGWSAGQLEKEIAEDVWLVVPYEHSVVFDTPFSERPVRAASSIGIDLNLISPNPGHG